MDVTLCGANAGQMWAEPVLMLTLGMMLVLPGLWLISSVLMPLLPAVRVVRTKLLPGIAALPVLRRMHRTGAARHAHDFFDGHIVRLRGRVVHDGLPRPTADGPAAVLCRQSIRNALGGVLSESMLARDFDVILDLDLDLDDGDAIRVQVEAAAGLRALVLLDGATDHWEGRGLARGWFYESRMCPGDDVEVVGTLLREIDPRGSAHGFGITAPEHDFHEIRSRHRLPGDTPRLPHLCLAFGSAAARFCHAGRSPAVRSQHRLTRQPVHLSGLPAVSVCPPRPLIPSCRASGQEVGADG